LEPAEQDLAGMTLLCHLHLFFCPLGHPKNAMGYVWPNA